MSARTATTRLLLPRRPGLVPPRSPPSPITPFPAASASPRRPFISLPGTPDAQTVAASRTLPHARDPLYDLIADVDSYAAFVPYCARSRVTRWSDPPDPATGRRWPARADLHVGWGGFDEAFSSRLRCVPGVSVEAVSGEGVEDASAVFRSIVTRWSLRPLVEGPQPSTEVHVSIRYQFVNPLYAAVSAAVSDKVAGLMVEAFEKRALQMLGSPRIT